MNDRGMKKWRPFNAVVPNRELLKKESSISIPLLSKDEISEFEEILKDSLYTHSKIKCFYIENGKEFFLEDYVLKLDPVKKNIYFKNKTLNFRQIHRIER